MPDSHNTICESSKAETLVLDGFRATRGSHRPSFNEKSQEKFGGG
jgi:hypothetical protein